MKTSALTALALISTSLLAEANDLRSIQSKIDQRINAPVAPVTETIEVNVPTEGLEARERALWSAINDGYNYLRSFDLDARYRFVFFATEARADGRSMGEWLTKEDALIQRLGQPSYFYKTWDQKVAAIKAAIADSEAPVAKMKVDATFTANGDDKEFPAQVRNDLDGIKIEPAVVVSPPRRDVVADVLEWALYGLAPLTAFAFGLTIRRRKEKELAKTQTAAVEVAPLPSVPVPASVLLFDQGTNIEDECRKMLTESKHLLDMAQLRVAPSSRAPFKTTIDAPSNKVSEALSWLLKGTIAIANSSGNKVSHMEWHCQEHLGRVSLEFVLHGIECDLKGLYLNTLVEAEGSAPAHFGRSEMALSEHLASVGFKAGNKKTTISLGLDSLAANLGH